MGNGVGKGYGCRQRTWQRDLATGPLNLSPAQRSVLSVPLSMSKCWPIVFVEGQIVSGWKHVGVVEGGGKSSLANCRFGISLCCVICLTVSRRHVSQASDSRIRSTAGVRRCCGSWLGWAAQAAFNCQPNCHVLQRQHPSGGEGLEPHAFSGKGTLSRNTTRPSFSATADWPLAHRAGRWESRACEALRAAMPKWKNLKIVFVDLQK